MRQLTRRATMKRSTKRSVVNTARSSCASQLDSIQRGQKLLDARLQDLQAASGKRDETVVKENVLHVRHLLTETQRALDILVKSMASTQNAIQTMATVVTAIYSRMCTTASATATAGPDVAMVIEVLSTQTSPQLQLSSASPPSDTREMPTEASASAAAMLLQLPQQKTDDDQSTSRPVVLKNTLRLQASTPGSYSEGHQITRKGGNMSRPEMVQLVNRLRHLPSTKSADAVNYKKHGRPS